jgi:ribosomal protein L17
VIKTTVPKAKEAARMAEKIITLGKKGTNPSISKAQAFLLPPHHYAEPAVPQKVAPITAPGVDAEIAPKTLLFKLFNTLAERYAKRPGGYTRITKFGRRPGDHAPVALVSLVDGPRDVRFEMTARAAAREATVAAREAGSAEKLGSEFKGTRDLTVMNVEKVLKYRGEEGKKEFEALAQEYAVSFCVLVWEGRGREVERGVGIGARLSDCTRTEEAPRIWYERTDLRRQGHDLHDQHLAAASQ